MKKQNQKFVLSVVIILGIFLLPMAVSKIETDTSAFAAAGSKLMVSKIQEKQRFTLSPPLKLRHKTSTFDPQVNPFTTKNAYHFGIDLAAKTGTIVCTAGAGVVEKAVSDINENPGYGKYIIIDHGSGIKTFYSYLSKVSVQKDEKVKKGIAIGEVGNTGKSTGPPHLHFEVILNKDNFNEEDFTNFDAFKKKK